MLYTIYRLLFENEDRYDVKIENDKLIYTEKIHIGPMTMMTIITYNIYDSLHRPKRKMRQDYLFLYILKLCFR